MRNRILWAEYFKRHNIEYIFFSAALAREKLDREDDDERESEFLDESKEANVPEEAKIVGALELVELLQSLCPQSEYSTKLGKRTIGFVGYPNVGTKNIVEH